MLNYVGKIKGKLKENCLPKKSMTVKQSAGSKRNLTLLVLISNSNFSFTLSFEQGQCSENAKGATHRSVSIRPGWQIQLFIKRSFECFSAAVFVPQSSLSSSNFLYRLQSNSWRQQTHTLVHIQLLESSVVEMKVVFSFVFIFETWFDLCVDLLLFAHFYENQGAFLYNNVD